MDRHLDDVKETSEEQTEELASDGYQVLAEKIEKLEGQLGVEKVILTDVGDRVQVTVQTPLGSVVFPLHHTPNTPNKMKSIVVRQSDSGEDRGAESPFPHAGSSMGMVVKGQAPVAGMTQEQIHDFKKQTLQVNTLQQKLKELETRIHESNELIQQGSETTEGLHKKESEDVKEIFMYLDSINTNISQKMADQRIEMQKLAGDTPPPINYDPFNYGDAYAGDIVDFVARKRIVEINHLLQGLNAGMAQLRDAVHVSPRLDLGYKVVRLDELMEATGFAASIESGELTNEDGFLITQLPENEPPEPRFPKKKAFQKDDNKTSWAMTDSIMQTMYRLETELGQLQKMIPSLDGESHIKEMEDVVAAALKHSKGKLMDETTIKNIIEKELKGVVEGLQQNTSLSKQSKIGKKSTCVDKPLFRVFDEDSKLEYALRSFDNLSSRVKNLENGPVLQKGSSVIKSHRFPYTCMTCAKGVERPIFKGKQESLPQFPGVSPFMNPRKDTYYKQPTRLRFLLQRMYRYQNPDANLDIYRMPRPQGQGYTHLWPTADPNMELKVVPPDLASKVFPSSEEHLIEGKDGRWYRGASPL